jgi:hypothetical protein
MILGAVKRGLSEERLARALNVNVASIRKKRNLLVGICPEVAVLLREMHVPLNAFAELRRLKPMRQIRAAEMMVAMNRFSLGYVQSIVAATPPDQLVEGKASQVKGLNAQQIDLMTEESARLDREFKLIEQTYGADHLDLVLASAYVTGLLDNARVVRYLAQFHANLLQEFQKTPHSGADRARWWGWRRTRMEPTGGHVLPLRFGAPVVPPAGAPTDIHRILMQFRHLGWAHCSMNQPHRADHVTDSSAY